MFLKFSNINNGIALKGPLSYTCIYTSIHVYNMSFLEDYYYWIRLANHFRKLEIIVAQAWSLGEHHSTRSPLI